MGAKDCISVSQYDYIAAYSGEMSSVAGTPKSQVQRVLKYTCIYTLPLYFPPVGAEEGLAYELQRLILSQTEGRCILLESSYITRDNNKKGRMADQSDLVPQKDILSRPVTSGSSVPSRPSHPPSPNFLADRK